MPCYSLVQSFHKELALVNINTILPMNVYINAAVSPGCFYNMHLLIWILNTEKFVYHLFKYIACTRLATVDSYEAFPTVNTGHIAPLYVQTLSYVNLKTKPRINNIIKLNQIAALQ